MTESIREIVWEFIYIIEFARKDKIFKAMVKRNKTTNFYRCFNSTDIDIFADNYFYHKKTIYLKI